ncbi:hypothetical protein K523DRAFT_71409 [Schizophyllum commune Tattone D]|nr:hypothetical protein K523DRAFT_71409 [Schizophyllum commune Tattone D]
MHKLRLNLRDLILPFTAAVPVHRSLASIASIRVTLQPALCVASSDTSDLTTSPRPSHARDRQDLGGFSIPYFPQPGMVLIMLISANRRLSRGRHYLAEAPSPLAADGTSQAFFERRCGPGDSRSEGREPPMIGILVLGCAPIESTTVC